MPAVELAVGDSAAVQVSGFFSDPDGDALTYAVGTSNAGVVTAAITGSAVTVVGVSSGTATVTVTARDPGGLAAQQSFAVTVPNRAPEVTDTIPELALGAGDSATFDLEEYFRDPDGDALTYTPETSEEAVAAASVSGATLTVRSVSAGTATVTVTARDPGGLAVQQSFAVTVPNRAPEVTDTIPPQRLAVGETRAWAGPEYFADPDGDALTYTVGTTDASIVLALVSGDEFGILAVTAGTATVTVTATDGDGLSASQSFRVTSEARGRSADAAVGTRSLEERRVLARGRERDHPGSGFLECPRKQRRPDRWSGRDRDSGKFNEPVRDRPLQRLPATASSRVARERAEPQRCPHRRRDAPDP